MTMKTSKSAAHGRFHVHVDISTWLNREGPKIDPAFATAPPVTPQQEPNEDGDSTPPAEPSITKSAASKDLREALLKYRDMNLEPPLIGNIETCTWDDIFDQMKDTQTEYAEKATKWKGLVHKLFRKVGDVGEEVVDPVLAFVPDDYGLSTVKAGISFIFTLAKHASENRKQILEAFENIPITVAAAESKRRLLPDDEDLRQASEQLSLAVLCTTTTLIGCLLPEKFGAKYFVYHWYKGKLSSKDTEKALEALKEATAKLKCLVEDILQQVVVEIKTRVVQLQNDTTDLKGGMDVLQSNATVIKDGVGVLQSDTIVIKDGVDVLHSDATAIKKDTSIIISNGEDTNNRLDHIEEMVGKSSAEEKRVWREAASEQKIINENLIQIMEEERRNGEQRIAQLEYQLQRERARTPGLGLMSLPQLLVALDMDSWIGQAAEDAKQALRHCNSIPPTAESESAWILRMPEFREWLRAGSSDMILVDGGIGYPDEGRFSTKSLLCTTLLASLAKMQPTSLRLYFFCGLHSKSVDPLRGPRGMLRSLISNLAIELHQRRWLNLDFIDDRLYRQALEAQDLETMCVTFHRLVTMAGGSFENDIPVYCILDGIAQYEYEFLQDLQRVVACLKGIVQDRFMKPVFKVFLTSTNRTKFVHQGLNQGGKHILVPSGMVEEGSLTSRGLESRLAPIFSVPRRQMQSQRGASMYDDDD